MPTRPLRPCSFPNCPNRTTGRYCQTHAKETEAQCRDTRGTRSERGYDYLWGKVRLIVLGREPWCRRCKAKGIWNLAQMVDHIVPLSRGGARLDPANLQPLCNSCHAEKTLEDQGHGEGGGKSLQV